MPSPRSRRVARVTGLDVTENDGDQPGRVLEPRGRRREIVAEAPRARRDRGALQPRTGAAADHARRRSDADGRRDAASALSRAAALSTGGVRGAAHPGRAPRDRASSRSRIATSTDGADAFGPLVHLPFTGPAEAGHAPFVGSLRVRTGPIPNTAVHSRREHREDHPLWRHRRHRSRRGLRPQLVRRERRRHRPATTPAATSPAPSIGAGASSQGSAQEAWIAAFQTANPDVTINYDPTGSGAGRETFIAGGVGLRRHRLRPEATRSSTAPSPRCAPDTGASTCPTYISPIAVIFNVEGVDELNLDAATIADIFKGDITTWDDPAIAALNEGVDAPGRDHHRRAPLGRLGHHQELLGLPEQGRPRGLGRRSRPTRSPTRPVRAPRAPRASSTPSPTAPTPSATPTRRRPATSVSRRSRSATSSSATPPRALPRSSTSRPLVEGRDANDLAIALDRTTDRPVALPARARLATSSSARSTRTPAQGELVKAYIALHHERRGPGRSPPTSAGAAPLSDDLSAKVADALVEAVK